MIKVLRQLPRNSSTIAAVNAAAISASITTPLTAAFTNTDWSNSGVTFTSAGEPVMRTVYSVAPNVALPDGRIRFCRFGALTTSAGARPRACSAAMSRSTEMSRFLPP